MAGRVRNWFGKSSKLPWDRIPELRGMPEARARDAFERARVRLRWSPSWWAAFLSSTLVLAAAPLIGYVGDPSERNRAFPLIIPLVMGVLGSLSVALFFRITDRAMRRFIRAELGTHYWQCDYDLRGTLDAVPPAVARCPECGRIIPRNVHRKTIGGEKTEARSE
jgi:hypothetical protein